MKIILTAALAISILSACATTPTISTTISPDRPTDNGLTCEQIKTEFAALEVKSAEFEAGKQAASNLMMIPILGMFAMHGATATNESTGRLRTLAQLGKAKSCT